MGCFGTCSRSIAFVFHALIHTVQVVHIAFDVLFYTVRIGHIVCFNYLLQGAVKLLTVQCSGFSRPAKG
jgi:hypothetical protein